MDLYCRFQRWFKVRFAILYPFVFYLIFFTNSDDHSINRGVGFVLAGLLLRLWANGYAIKLDKLTTSGPYAYVRHPLYLGTTLILLGFIITLKVYLIGALFFILFAAIYARTMGNEERMLLNKFNTQYIQYRSCVPAIVPSLRNYEKGEKWPFSFQRLINSQEYKVFLWIIILLTCFHLKNELLVEREAMDAKMWILLFSIPVLGFVDVLLDRFRKNNFHAFAGEFSLVSSSAKTHILVLVLLSSVFFFLGNSAVPLTNPDEVFYAQTAKEMIAHQTWTVPYLFDGPNFEKPIFSYWLLEAAFSILGVSSFTARLFPAIFALIGVLGIYWLGRSAFRDNRKAFYCALILMSAALYVALARTVFTDMFFTVLIELSLVCFYWGYGNRERKTHGLFLFWVFAACAVLTKGILGVAIPFVVITLFLIFRKEVRFLMCREFVVGGLVFLAIALPWYVYMIKNFGSSFIQEFFYNDHLQRLIEAEHKSNDRWFFYPLSMVGLMAPWSIFVVLAASNLLKRKTWRSSPIHLFLMIWVAVVFCVFQFAHSKLVSYIFPLFPALALLVGDYVSDVVDEIKLRRWFFVSAHFVLAIVVVLAVGAGTVFAKFIDWRLVHWPALMVCFFIMFASLYMIWRRDDAFTRMGVLLIQIPLLLAFSLPQRQVLEQYVSSKKSAEYLLQKYKATGPIICSKSDLRAIRFFMDQDVRLLNLHGEGKFFSAHPVAQINSQADILALLKDRSEIYGVISQSSLKDLRESFAPLLQTKILAVFGKEYVVSITK